MRISEVARRTGASAKAIRLYEARGLLPPVPRLNRYRDYSEQDVAWVQLIRQALGLGIGLAAITRLQRSASSTGRQCWFCWSASALRLLPSASGLPASRSNCSRWRTSCGNGCSRAMVFAFWLPLAAPPVFDSAPGA